MRAGYVASATPAASAIASPPATRVVFLVATTGKPSGGPRAGTSSPVWPVTGGVSLAVGVPLVAAAAAAGQSKRARQRDGLAQGAHGDRG